MGRRAEAAIGGWPGRSGAARIAIPNDSIEIVEAPARVLAAR
jgi:hypothetical protein